MAGIESTVERIGSVAVVLSIPLFILSIILGLYKSITVYEHGYMALVGGFTIFCLGVTLPLYASLSGGYPRRGLDLALLIVIMGAVIGSLAVYLMGSVLNALILLSISMASTILYTLNEMKKAKPKSLTRYILVYPYIMGFIASVYGYLQRDLLGFFIVYVLGYASPLVGVVGLFYLSRSYKDRRPLLGSVGLLLNALSIIVIMYNMTYVRHGLLYTVSFFATSLSLLLVSLSLGFWGSIASSREHVKYLARGHLMQFIGIILSIVFAFNVKNATTTNGIILYIHSLLIGHALIGIYTQAIMLSPLIIASTWRRRRLNVYPHILALAAISLRPFYPAVSGLLIILSLAYLLLSIRPSIKRIMYIIVYGTEKGYLLAYKSATKS